MFDDRNVLDLVGKRMGVILGMEEYHKKSGEIGQRLYVYQVRSTDIIRDNDFDVPELKRVKNQDQPYGSRPTYGKPSSSYAAPTFSPSGFTDIEDDGDSDGEGKLPF